MRFFRHNVGPVDQGIRLTLAVVIALLTYYSQVIDELALLSNIVVVILILTGGLRWSPTYALFAELRGNSKPKRGSPAIKKS